jgi:hypothetical protein
MKVLVVGWFLIALALQVCMTHRSRPMDYVQEAFVHNKARGCQHVRISVSQSNTPTAGP